MLVILKIPVVYLCAVVWYAIRAEPELDAGDGGTPGERTPRPWRPWHSWHSHGPRPRRGGPHGSPRRTYDRAPRPAGARAAVKR